MITKEEFIKLITDHQKWSERVDKVGEVLDCFIFDLDWVEYGGRLFDDTLKLLFTEDGVDDIGWWLYEKAGHPDMKMWDENGNEIPTETVEDLWNIVVNSRK